PNRRPRRVRRFGALPSARVTARTSRGVRGRGRGLVGALPPRCQPLARAGPQAMNLSPRRRLFLRMVSGSLWRRPARLWISLGAGLLLVSRDVERMVARELRVYGPNIIVRPRSEEAASGLRDVRVGAVHSRETFSAPAASWPNDTVTPQGPVRSESALSLLYG